ncbi:MAG: metal-dependent transcriptional regulator [Acidobacteriaceae bacterium]
MTKVVNHGEMFVMQEEVSVSRENYLKAIIEAESEGLSVVPTLLSHWLNVSPPAVTKAIRRLREDGFVEDSKEGFLGLTQKGRQVAHRTAYRHYLVERMLSEVFGMEWHLIHAEAERIEHVISPEFEKILVEKLGPDGACPHGNGVLPETPAQSKRRGLTLLSDAEEGARYVVAKLYERDNKLLEFLHKLGIGPDVSLLVLERNYDDTLKLDLGGRSVVVGHSAASRIWVKPSSAPTKAKI